MRCPERFCSCGLTTLIPGEAYHATVLPRLVMDTRRIESINRSRSLRWASYRDYTQRNNVRGQIEQLFNTFNSLFKGVNCGPYSP